MEFSHPFIGMPELEGAIDYRPLIVSPSASLGSVIDQMSQAQGHSCGLINDGLVNSEHISGQLVTTDMTSEDEIPEMSQLEFSQDELPFESSSGRTSCALVAEGDYIVGIFTERDIVKLVAENADIDQLTVADVMVSPVISLSKAEFNDIFAALFLFRRYRIRHLLIVDEGDRPVGVVSPASIRRVLRPANLLKLRRVSDIMARDVVCADHSESVLTLAQLMARHRISCVVITAEDDDRGSLPVGIITERDIVQFKTLQLNLATLRAELVMSAPLFLLSPEDSLWTAHQEMQRLRVRRLVVSWNWGKSLGIVTQTSLLRVFDPLEMYGVLETLHKTVQQLQTEESVISAATSLPQQESAHRPLTSVPAPLTAIAQASDDQSTTGSQSIPEAVSVSNSPSLAQALQPTEPQSVEIEVGQCLNRLQHSLHNLATHLPAEHSSTAELTHALSDVQRLRQLLQYPADERSMV